MDVDISALSAYICGDVSFVEEFDHEFEIGFVHAAVLALISFWISGMACLTNFP